MVVPQGTDPNEIVPKDYVPEPVTSPEGEEEVARQSGQPAADSCPARTSTHQSASVKSKPELCATSSAAPLAQIPGSEVNETLPMWRPGDFADCKLIAGVRPLAWTSAVLVMHAFLCQGTGLNKKRIWDRVTVPVLQIFWPASVAVFWKHLSGSLESKVTQVLKDLKLGKLSKPSRRKLRLNSNKVLLLQVKGIGMRERSIRPKSKRKNRAPISTADALGGVPITVETELDPSSHSLSFRSKRPRPPPGYHAVLGLEGRVDDDPAFTRHTRQATHQLIKRRRDVVTKQRRDRPFFLQESNRHPLPPPPPTRRILAVDPPQGDLIGFGSGNGSGNGSRLSRRQSDIATELSRVANVLYNVAERLEPSLCEPLESAVRVLESYHAQPSGNTGYTSPPLRHRRMPQNSNKYLQSSPARYPRHSHFLESISASRSPIGDHYASPSRQPPPPPAPSLRHRVAGPLGMLGPPVPQERYHHHVAVPPPRHHSNPSSNPTSGPFSPPVGIASGGVEGVWQADGLTRDIGNLVTQMIDEPKAFIPLLPSVERSMLHQKVEGYCPLTHDSGDNLGDLRRQQTDVWNRSELQEQVKEQHSQNAVDIAEKLISFLEGNGQAVIVPDALSDSNGKLSVSKLANALDGFQNGETEVCRGSIVQLLALLDNGDAGSPAAAAPAYISRSYIGTG